MTDNEKQPSKESPLTAEEIKQLARYQSIKKADLIREAAIQKTSKVKEVKRAKKRDTDDIEQSARYQTIRNADLAREQALHKVYITKDFGAERNKELMAFIDKNIAEYKGKTEEKLGISLMLFDTQVI